MAFACLALSTRAIAEPGDGRSDTQFWLSPKVTVPLGGRAEVSAEVLAEVTDGLSRPGLLLIRPLVSYRLSDRLSVGGGYTYVGADDHVGSHFHEHRAVEEFTLVTSPRQDRLLLSARTRLEQRRREDEVGTHLRLREMIRVDAPIGGEKRLVGWSEIFVGLNRTSWSPTRGAQMVQSFAGIHLPISDGIAVEPGYLNQTYLDAGRNRVRHALSVFVAIRLR